MKEVLEFLKKCSTYYLGTINNGKPDIRPFGTIHEYNGKLYFQTGKIKNVSKQINQNPNIFICAFDGNKWIRIDAKAYEDDSIEASEDLLKEYESLRRMYTPGDGNCTTYYLTDVKAVISSFTDKPIEYNF